MDALDGKQARRTGSSSPLGQLFDHGVDALAVIFEHQLAAAYLMMGPIHMNFIGLVMLLFDF